MELALFCRPCAMNFETAPTFMENLCTLTQDSLTFLALLLTGLNSTDVTQNFKRLKSRSKSVVLLDEISLLFN
jgi:hypothetical protein